MDFDKLSSMICRVFFVGAFFLLLLAILEKIVNFAGYTILRSYEPGRILEFASILIIFVIALLMRQVRDYLKNGGTTSG